MTDNYLKSALDAQHLYHETVERCLYALLADTFRAHPALHRVQVELDYIPNPPYSCTYVIREVMVDLGCGWVAMPSQYIEDVGKIVHFIYTHAQAVSSVKGVGLLAWYRATYNL